jgi:hypothetical protein
MQAPEDAMSGHDDPATCLLPRPVFLPADLPGAQHCDRGVLARAPTWVVCVGGLCALTALAGLTDFEKLQGTL